MTSTGVVKRAFHLLPNKSVQKIHFKKDSSCEVTDLLIIVGLESKAGQQDCRIQVKRVHIAFLAFSRLLYTLRLCGCPNSC